MLKCASASECGGGIGGADGEKLMSPWWPKRIDVEECGAFIVELNVGRNSISCGF